MQQFYTPGFLLVSLFAFMLAQCHAKPLYYYEDGDTISDDGYAVTYGKPLTGSTLRQLSPGYYYVDDGYIAPVSGRSNTLPDSVRFKPLARYKHTKSQRKKLFVPNFFG